MSYSSKAAIDLVVGFEIGSRQQYENKYKHPEWPGGQSGVTIGIGYDLGYTTEKTFMRDFGDVLAPPDFNALAETIGKTGQAAKAALAAVKHIVVPWDDAMRVFTAVDVPKYEDMIVKACPNAVNMPGDCFGAIFSIVYNRGAGGFHAAGDRYKEMRAIAADIQNGTWTDIPKQIRSMKRLWNANTQGGLITRREKEAQLFEEGLRASSVSPRPVPKEVPAPVSTVDEQYKKSMNGQYSITIETLQRKLEEKLCYFEVGKIDGRWGGRTRGAVTAFMNDRHQPTNGLLTQAVMDEVNKALQEGWTRPIAPERKEATVDEVAKTVPAVTQTFWNKVWAIVLGLPSAAAALVKLIFGDQPTPAAYIEPIKNAVAAIPPELYLVAVVGICVAVFVQAKRAQDATVDAYRQGKIN